MIRTGIIGLGAIGQRIIHAFNNHPKIKITAVCDHLEELADKTAATYNVQAFTNHEEMLEQMQFDLVYVAVPPKYHHQVASAVIEKDIHILCEKPLSNSLEEAVSLHESAQSASIVHAMNFPLHYQAESRMFSQLLRTNYIGELRRVELKMHFPNWPRLWQQNAWVGSREQGGFTLEVGIHFIQQIQQIFGPVNVINKSIQYPKDPEASEDALLAVLNVDNGIPVLLDGIAHTAGSEQIAFTAYGTKGTLSLLDWSKIEGGKIGDQIKPIEADQRLSLSLVDELVKAIEGENAELVTFSAGLEAQRVLEQLRS